MKLSVIIITFNEEKNIRRCIESVTDIADEIVVVDSFSSDDTETICHEYHVKFVQQKWLGYSEQKNFANNLATNDWVFSIDADEAISETLKKSILEIKKHDYPENSVFSMNRITSYCGKWIRHCGWYPDTKIRIWNRKKGEWKGKIHETIHFKEGSVATTLLAGDLLHYSFATPKDYEKQMFHFAEIGGHAYFEKGKKNATFFYIFSPIITFFRQYFIRKGFLEGAVGFKISWIAAKATRYKYATLKQLNKNKV